MNVFSQYQEKMNVRVVLCFGIKSKKIAVISDNELPPIKVGDVTIVEFITIPNDVFTKALKDVIKAEKKFK